MRSNVTWRAVTAFLTLAILFSLFSNAVMAAPSDTLSAPVTFSILHTNDFHGQLQAANANPDLISTPGMARTARVINAIRAAKGASNVLLVDAGDEMQGSLLSNLGDGSADGKGMPTIATFNQMGYDVATFGNHEFDWGQTVLANRTAQANYPFVTANIVQNDTGNCNTAGWLPPAFADGGAYVIKTIGTAPNQVKVAFIGVTSLETPTITIASATNNLCFKDPKLAIEHYWNTIKTTDQADVIVVLSHLGYTDGGYGYGIPVYGDQTLAKNLITDGYPVNMIIGGHSHTSVAAPGTTVTVSGKTGSTLVAQSAYNGRRVGQADITVATDGTVSISWKVTIWTQKNGTNPAASEWRTFTTSSAFTADTDVSEDAGVAGVISTYANDANYLALVNTPIGYSAVDLGRSSVADNMMGTFIDDAIYNYLNTDGDNTNDIDMFFNNAGGLRTDWCWNGSSWQTSSCVSGSHAAGLLNYGNMFTVLPFGNATVVGQMTGAHILEVLNWAANIAHSGSSPAGLIQPAGIKYKYYDYKDANPGPQPYAWGAYDVQVYDKGTSTWVPLDLTKTYSVGTNEYLAPAGGDGFNGFKYMTNVTYWGDMLNAVNAYVAAHYGTEGTAYNGPNSDGTLDGRIGLNGDGDTVYDPGEIVPLTVLHHSDPHGNMYKSGTYAGITQLATLIAQERAHNPTRTLLLNAGDTIQGDGMSYYFKSSYTGKAADGTSLAPSLTTDPIIAAMNLIGYDAMTLGNHEFNFGSDVFKGVISQANFPILDADVADGTGGNTYGLGVANHGVGVQPYLEKTLGAEGIKVGIIGLGNPRIPNYELPSNILGLTFARQIGVDDPITRAQTNANTLRANGDDVVLALSHLGFTDPTDPWVDTYLAANTTGIDAILGGHSHTDPTNSVAYPYIAPYKVLPGIWAAADGKPVAINHTYRYNYFLGEVAIGLRAKAGGGYEVVSQTGRNIAVCAGGKTGIGTTCTTDTVEDTNVKALIDPYKAVFDNYNNLVIGSTTTPIDTLLAYTQETNGANLQADASVYELETVHGIPVDFHLSGAMTNKVFATSATPASPVSLKISDMFAGMPYENSLLVLRMNGPQLKTVLERAYWNYWNYKYTTHSSISYYTTCMLDTNFGNRITYNDQGAGTPPSGNDVVSLNIGGHLVDFNDAATFYNVSTVNYLAAGSCNFNDAGVSLWPLDQLVADTQYYVRDATIDYITYKGIVSPAIEGRLQFAPDLTAPTVVGSTLAGSSPTKASSVNFTLTFSEAVANLGISDLSLTTTGVTGASITGISGGPTAYTVAVNTGTGSGTIHLNVRTTATVNDLSGNALTGLPYTSGGTYTVDKTAPVVTPPSNQTVEATKAGGADVTYTNGTATDADPATPAVSCVPASGSTFAVGNTTVTCSATDTAGNTGTATFTVTVTDTTVPTVDTFTATSPSTSLNVPITAFTASDAVGVTGYMITESSTAPLAGAAGWSGTAPTTYAASSNGSYTLYPWAKDAAGNVSALFGTPASVVVDAVAPVVTVPANQTAEATSASGAVVTYSGESATDTDPASPAVSCLPASGSTFPLGDTTVTCSATDTAGNIGTNTFTVSVVDTTNPAVTVPANKTVEATSASGAVVSFSASATDTVDPLTPSVLCSPASGSTFPLGNTVVNCSATDTAGNTGTNSFTISVKDTSKPNALITAKPANQTFLRTATFSFTGTDSGSTGVAYFECKLDAGEYALCVSPRAYTTPLLVLGSHTFSVRAIDHAGNMDATPASYTWLVRGERALNGGFETYPTGSKIPTYWKNSNFSPTTDGQDITAGNSHEGKAAVKIVGTSATKTLTQTLYSLSGKAGEVFNLSFWVKGKTVPAGAICQVQVLFYNGPFKVGTQTKLCGAVGTTYAQRVLTFKTTSLYTSVQIVVTYKGSATTASSVWFDQISLIK